MNNREAVTFLCQHGMTPERIDPAEFAVKMCEDMEHGLCGAGSSMPMIPTYIENDGLIPINRAVAVIDAGGTNFRTGLVTFTEQGYTLACVSKQKMPGIETSTTWNKFISFVADNLMPLMGKTDYIGFCFSYNAEITPEIDGRVKCIDKEVIITESSGKLVGGSLISELERRGVNGKRIVILNDTVAALLGSTCTIDRDRYSGFIGQISGTGTNTCCALPYRRIKKLDRDEDAAILVNLESGMYSGFPQGDFDIILDRESNNPGEKSMEKLTAGVYLGALGKLMLNAAADEQLLSSNAAEKIKNIGRIDASVIDAWASGDKLQQVCGNESDRDFVKDICAALFERSARCMCANLIGIMLLTDSGKDERKPVCVCAEGSLVDKSRFFRPMLERLLKEYAAEKLNRYAIINVGHETTLPGSAAAALLNIR